MGPLTGSRRAGFTLLELAIALFIGAFTVTALYSLFTVQSRQLVMQDLQMEMHQNLRFSADMVNRSVRLAGFNTPGEIRGALGLSSVDDTLPVIIPSDGGSGDPDAITVIYGDPGLTVDTQNDQIEACNATELHFRPGMLDNQARMAQWDDGEYLLCYDYADMSGRKSFLWNMTADASASGGIAYIEDGTAYADYDTTLGCASGQNLTPVLTCTQAHVYTFYVDDDSGDGIGPGSSTHPVLMLDLDMSWPEDDDVPLADNIEDFQVEYCVDDGTGAVDCSVDTNWVDTFDAATEADNVYMVRMSFVAKSSRPHPGELMTTTPPALANRSAGTSDHYMREVLTTEVTVRNVRLLTFN